MNIKLKVNYLRIKISIDPKILKTAKKLNYKFQQGNVDQFKIETSETATTTKQPFIDSATVCLFLSGIADNICLGSLSKKD